MREAVADMLHDGGHVGFPAPARPMIECRHLSKIVGAVDAGVAERLVDRSLAREEGMARYGAVVAVRDVSFSVVRGETFCIMGLSGCGKSTLLRLVNRLIAPSAGSVRIADTEISTLGAKAMRAYRSRHIGMVFQSYGLFPHLTVVENVAFGLEVRGVDRETRTRIALEKLDIVGLQGRASSYPEQLSGGMRQRVGIARALAADTDILLLDEPFSALDPLIRRELQAEFVEIVRSLGKTAIFITHDFEEAVRVGSGMAIMRDGEFIQVGTAGEILRAPADPFVARFVDMARERPWG